MSAREKGSVGEPRGAIVLARSVERYREAAEGLVCRQAGPAGTHFELRPTQLEILRATEALAECERSDREARRAAVKSASTGKAQTPSPRWNAAHDGTMTSLLRWVAPHLESIDPQDDDEDDDPDGFWRLQERLDRESVWKSFSPILVPIGAVRSVFRDSTAANGAHGKGLERARELYRQLQKAIAASEARGGRPAQNDEPDDPPGGEGTGPARAQDQARVEQCATATEGLYVCVGWRESGNWVQIEKIAGPLAGPDSLVIHQLSALVGYDLQKCGIAKPGGARCVGCTCAGWICARGRWRLNRRWTVVLLRRWLQHADRSTGDGEEARAALRAALRRVDEKRAEGKSEQSSVRRETVVAFLWRAETANAAPWFAKYQLLKVWNDRSSLRERPIKGGRGWKQWMIAYRKKSGGTALEPHEWWSRGW